MYVCMYVCMYMISYNYVILLERIMVQDMQSILVLDQEMQNLKLHFLEESRSSSVPKIG